MKGEVFAEYLQHLCDQVPYRGQTVHLICEGHTPHRTATLKQTSTELNMVLVFIPPAATDRREPLDRYLFASLKSEARRLFRQRISDVSGSKRSTLEAIEDMTTAWARFSDETLKTPWDLSESDEEWGHDVETENTTSRLLRFIICTSHAIFSFMGILFCI
jgi:hypothetical protein